MKRFIESLKEHRDILTPYSDTYSDTIATHPTAKKRHSRKNYIVICSNCGREFKACRCTAKYCSQACKTMAKRKGDNKMLGDVVVADDCTKYLRYKAKEYQSKKRKKTSAKRPVPPPPPPPDLATSAISLATIGIGNLIIDAINKKKR